MLMTQANNLMSAVYSLGVDFIQWFIYYFCFYGAFLLIAALGMARKDLTNFQRLCLMVSAEMFISG